MKGLRGPAGWVVAGGRGPQLDLWTLAGIAAHVLLVGSPIAQCARRAGSGFRA